MIEFKSWASLSQSQLISFSKQNKSESNFGTELLWADLSQAELVCISVSRLSWNYYDIYSVLTFGQIERESLFYFTINTLQSIMFVLTTATTVIRYDDAFKAYQGTPSHYFGRIPAWVSSPSGSKSYSCVRGPCPCYIKFFSFCASLPWSFFWLLNKARSVLQGSPS